MKIVLDRRLLSSLLILGSMVEARDFYTGGHLWRVGQFSRLLAEAAGLERDEVFLAAIGGFLHDLGKIGISDAILNKRASLTDDEYAVIKTHPSIGRAVLSEHPLAPLALDAVAYHHERHDGTGYPDHLAEDQIPLIARIVSIADAFDAMTSTRPYRKGLPLEDGLTILDEWKGRQFHSGLVDLFVALGYGGRLDGVVGHSHHGSKLATCPFCGPVVAVHDLADGAIHACRACGGQFRLHKKGDDFELEEVGLATPDQMRPLPDLAPVRDLVGEMR